VKSKSRGLRERLSLPSVVMGGLEVRDGGLRARRNQTETLKPAFSCLIKPRIGFGRA
jgi:hypothetical protein